MNRCAWALGAWALAMSWGGAARPAEAPRPPPSDTFEHGRFGLVSVYRPPGAVDSIVLFLSGDGGWNLGVVSMARRLAAAGAVVAGIDIRHYLAELEAASDACVSPAADLADLGRRVAQSAGAAVTLKPILVGYSSGATLVYATLGEASPGRFAGALSLGFCPDLDLKRPVCRGAGIASTPRRDAHGVLKGVNFLPVDRLPAKWISLQGQTDQVCPAAATQEFMAKVPGAEFVLLPKVGHGYSVERNWVPQYEAAFSRLRDAVSGPPAGAP